jgi:hypothetical protein
LCRPAGDGLAARFLYLPSLGGPVGKMSLICAVILVFLSARPIKR